MEAITTLDAMRRSGGQENGSKNATRIPVSFHSIEALSRGVGSTGESRVRDGHFDHNSDRRRKTPDKDAVGEPSTTSVGTSPTTTISWPQMPLWKPRQAPNSAHWWFGNSDDISARSNESFEKPNRGYQTQIIADGNNNNHRGQCTPQTMDGQLQTSPKVKCVKSENNSKDNEMDVSFDVKSKRHTRTIYSTKQVCKYVCFVIFVFLSRLF